MAVKWQWNVKPLGLDVRCGHCQQYLRLNQDAGIVTWVGKDYHVGCLLDRLAATEPTPLPHWGVLNDWSAP